MNSDAHSRNSDAHRLRLNLTDRVDLEEVIG